MKLLTVEQIEEIRGLQKALDERILKENNIEEGTDLSLEKYLALKTELFELVNEVESFKYWKKNQGKDSILEEACDTLHFIFSLAIDNDVPIALTELQNTKDLHTNEIFGMIDAMISDCYMLSEWGILSIVVVFLCEILERNDFDSDDLYNAYIKKNQTNHERQDNNY